MAGHAPDPVPGKKVSRVPRRLRYSGLLLGLLVAAALGSPNLISGTLPSLESTELSPDITIQLSGIRVDDEDVFTGMGDNPLADLGAIPHYVDTTAFHRDSNGDLLVAFDMTTELPGDLIYRPGDVVRYDGVSYTLEFDAFANGVPRGVNTDAVSVWRNGDLLLSFDATVRTDNLVLPDEDVARFDGVQLVAFFDASAAGIDPVLDLDAMHYDAATDSLIMSFDAHGDLTAFQFADEDLVAYDLEDSGWSLVLDAASGDPSWIRADLDAAYLTFIMDQFFNDGFE